MKTKFSYFKENAFREHELRLSKGYKPKYRSGLIAIRFLDDEKFKDGDVDDQGKIYVDYQEVFSNKNSKYVKYFEDKYGIKISDYRSGTDDYYIYFKCKPGEEKEKIEEISKDKIVKVVDFVDTRELEDVEELNDIIDHLVTVAENYSSVKNEESKKHISEVIERLKRLM